MATCDWCDLEMKDPAVTSCPGNTEVEFPDGTVLPASTQHFEEPSGRCHDCNVMHGGFHHPGCDAERCPRCEGQLIGCGCLDQVMLSETILAGAGAGLDCAMRAPDEGYLCLDGVPDDFHVFVNGDPAFDGYEVEENDTIELKLRRKPNRPGPFVRPTLRQALWQRIKSWLRLGRVTIDMK